MSFVAEVLSTRSSAFLELLSYDPGGGSVWRPPPVLPRSARPWVAGPCLLADLRLPQMKPEKQQPPPGSFSHRCRAGPVGSTAR